jgi:hypothetical protein
LLAVAWLSAAAAPCAAMNPPAEADPGSSSYDLTRLDRSARPPASSPTHTHPAVHDHADCPHCPPSAGGEREATSLGHGGCSESESVGDGRGNVLPKWDLKHAQPIAVRTIPEPSFHAHHPDLELATAISLPARIPLHIRYCTYLI